MLQGEKTVKRILEKTEKLTALLGYDEQPFGMYFNDIKPDGFGPKPGEIFSREREKAGEIDWSKAFGNFTCLVGSIWLARKKHKAAYISLDECGCMGGGFYTGMYYPYLETQVGYVSTGIPGTPHEGEHYLPSPESMRHFLDASTPPLATKKYCILQPIDLFTDEEPLVIAFFARPEVMSGLFALVSFATGHYNSVLSPFDAGCTNLVAWPLIVAQQGKEQAILGGFDLSARRFFKTDELTLAMPFYLYRKMLDVVDESALVRETWPGVMKKVHRSRKAWGEE